jgi:hypothetical protein
VLQWLVEHDIVVVKLDPEPCITAADHGALEVLRFLHEHGCAWNSGVCTAAASRGDLAVLQYAHEHGCPWTVETTKAAGDPAPYQEQHQGVSDEHPRASALEVLRYLHTHGCPWHPDALLYAEREVIAWARSTALPMRHFSDDRYGHEHGYPPAGFPGPPGFFDNHDHAGVPYAMPFMFQAAPPPHFFGAGF